MASRILSILATATILLSACVNRTQPDRDRRQSRTDGAPQGGVTEQVKPGATPSTQPNAGPMDGMAQNPTSPLQLICSVPQELANFAAEIGSVCSNGQPTETFTNAYASPYRGGTNPPLTTVKSEVNGRTSEVILLAVIESPLPIDEASAKRTDLRKGTLTGGGATMTKTVVSSTPGDGAKNLGSAEIRSNFRYLIVNKTTVLTENVWALDQQKNVQAAVTFLKPGATENANAKLANSVGFMIAEGAKTMVVSINHQIDDNGGQPQTAARIVAGLGKAAMQDAFQKLSQ